MKLEEAIKIIKDIDTLDDIELQEAYSTVLQELERLQKENEDKKTYEFGLIVGTKRERDWWQNKIREKIEEIKEKYEEGYAMENQAKLDILQDLLKEE